MSAQKSVVCDVTQTWSFTTAAKGEPGHNPIFPMVSCTFDDVMLYLSNHCRFFGKKKQESKVQKIASDQTTPEKLSPIILPTILASKKLSLQYVPLLLLFAKDNPFELLFKLVNIESMIVLAHCI